MQHLSAPNGTAARPARRATVRPMRPRAAFTVLGVLGSGLLAPAAAAAQEPPEPPSRMHGSTVARGSSRPDSRAPSWTRRSAAGRSTTTAWSAQPQVLLVLDSTTVDGRDWVKLLLADRPNGSGLGCGATASCSAAPATGSPCTCAPGASSSTRTEAHAPVPGGRRRSPHADAAWARRDLPAQPPTGSARDPRGPWALSLTSLVQCVESYGGGPGRVAIHGRAGASLRDPLGSALVRVRPG